MPSWRKHREDFSAQEEADPSPSPHTSGSSWEGSPESKHSESTTSAMLPLTTSIETTVVNDETITHPVPIPVTDAPTATAGEETGTGAPETAQSWTQSQSQSQTVTWTQGWTTGTSATTKWPDAAASASTSLSLPQTSTTSQTANPYVQHSSAAPDTTGTSDPATGNGSASSSGAAISNQDGVHSGPSVGLIIAAVVVPLVTISVIAFAAFLIWRRRRAQHELQQERALEEMKMRGRGFGFGGAGMGGLPGTHSPSPPYQSSPRQNTGATRTPPPAHTPTPSAAPVIIAPMASGSGAYFTGIDTSEALSIRSSEREPTGGFMLDGEHHEEPPPPYRPASVPALSRDSSVRQQRSEDANANASSTHLMAGSPDTVVRSPFADPDEEEDAVSDISTPTGTYARRQADELSLVSDLSYDSYQDGPARIHQTV